MGLGMLRRYHARPDDGVERATGHETPAPPVTGEQNTPEVNAAKDAWEAAAKVAADATSALTDFKEADGRNLEALTEEEQSTLDSLVGAAQAANDAEEAAKVAFEEAEALSGKFNPDTEKVEEQVGQSAQSKIESAESVETPEARAERASAAGLSRNSSKEAWRTFAGAGFEEQGRDQIAEYFLGPKS